MSDASSKQLNRPDLEAARLGMKVEKGAPPVQGLEGPDGTRWDKPAPKGPPNVQIRKIPSHLKKVVGFFNALIADEGLLLDLCFEHAMELVQSNVESKMVGTDNFVGDGEGAVSSPFNAATYASIAGPLACELYKNVIEAIKGRAGEYEEIVAEANREREKQNPGPSTLILP
jgi:hypothetical protein